MLSIVFLFFFIILTVVSCSQPLNNWRYEKFNDDVLYGENPLSMFRNNSNYNEISFDYTFYYNEGQHYQARKPDATQKDFVVRGVLQNRITNHEINKTDYVITADKNNQINNILLIAAFSKESSVTDQLTFTSNEYVCELNFDSESDDLILSLNWYYIANMQFWVIYDNIKVNYYWWCQNTTTTFGINLQIQYEIYPY